MNTVLVWVLITLGGAGGDQMTYSPPMPDLATCEFLKKNALETRPSAQLKARCVQIRIMVPR